MGTHALLVGAGLVGGAIGAALARRGWHTSTVGRRGQHRIDLSTPDGRAALRRLVAAGGHDLVLLCHGPSDVTWCEDHPVEALRTHAGTTVAVADLGVPTVLISTDNVFPGTRTTYRSTDRTDPPNAYGRAKLAAEQALRACGGRVVRVSLVYGWSGGGLRRNFAERCLVELRAGRPVRAPRDQFLTPVHVADVAEATATYLTAPRPEAPVVHLAGPEALSRSAFAVLAAHATGASERLVVPVPRASTELACRPPCSGLAWGPFRVDGPLGGFRPRDPRAGLATMLAEESG